MEYTLTSKQVLHKLGISKNYTGYDYILYGLSLVKQNEYYLSNITKILYVDIAKEFHTSPTCVERNIRKVIEVIWSHVLENQPFIETVFGSKYLAQKPTNREFLELLYEYMSCENILLDVLEHYGTVKCPISNKPCTLCSKIINALRNQ